MKALKTLLKTEKQPVFL